jgi:protein O-GlcNAc transferase
MVLIVQQPTSPSDSYPELEITGSRQFIEWLQSQQISLAFTTYQSNRLFLIGINSKGKIAAVARIFDRAMGLYATPERLYMSSRYQVWQFDNVLQPGQIRQGYDRLYFPRIGYTTGELDIHDLVVSADNQVIFVNTLFSCLATLSDRYSFTPLWKPPFISKLATEDRCHLNGLAMVEGQPRYVTAFGQTDVADGWREKRHNGGCVMDIVSNEIILTGLSCPHSPRFYQGKLWLLNSGTGEFGYVDLQVGKFEPVTFGPGYLRGLAFWGDYAIVGLSKPREKTFSGLALDEELTKKNADPRCGLIVIDLNTGDIVHWLRVEGVISELYDVQVLPQIQCPSAVGFKTEEVRNLLNFDPNWGA